MGPRGGPARRRPPRQPPARTQAAELPVARVAVEVSLAHLDRPFDYLVPAKFAEAAVPGCRVRVRFAGKLTDGYLLERSPGSDQPGKLAFLDRVVSAEPVLTAELAGPARPGAATTPGTPAAEL